MLFSKLLASLLFLIIEFHVKWFSLSSLCKRSKKLSSNFFNVLLNNDLFVVYSSDQTKNNWESDVSKVAQVRSISAKVCDLNWLIIISINLTFVVLFIKNVNWWLLFMSSMSWKVNRVNFSLIIKMFNVLTNKKNRKKSNSSLTMSKKNRMIREKKNLIRKFNKFLKCF